METKTYNLDTRLLGFTSVALIMGMGFIFTLPALASEGEQGNRVECRDGERHEQMEKALDSRDYDAWKELMSERNTTVAEKVSKENFDKFIAMHEARQAGDTAKADALRKELDLPERGTMHRGMHHMQWRQDLELRK
jgi:hypothetical protein